MALSVFRIRALVIKELLALVRDKRSRIVLIGPPLFQLVIFSFAATLEVENIVVAIHNRDRGQASTEIVQRMVGSPNISTVLFADNERELAGYINRQEALAGFSFQEDFTERLAQGRDAPIQAVLDGRRSNAAQIALGYVSTMVEEFARERAAVPGTARAPPGEAAAVEVVERNAFNANLENLWTTVTALVAILSMVLGLLVTSLSVARERELGTYNQILVSPLTPLEILAGKTVPAFIVAVAEGTIMVLAAIFVFQVPFRGSLLLLYGGLLAFLASIVGVGLFISSLCRTQQQAILGAFLFMVPAVILSGFATPIENMPWWLQDVTVANPVKYFLVIVKGVFLKDMSAAVVWANTWPMLCIAVVTMTVAWFFFSKGLEE
ncbi:ABC transporter permease [Desulfohalovibrio reitneri]|uniref:ABC transporter permease n=1 Tax=Desulfohalovibrio reitneri TaxID=1307759 RepID=UPI0004A6D587|nr:ABC transporter permease [Desulfohalovibrio reitneri]